MKKRKTHITVTNLQDRQASALIKKFTDESSTSMDEDINRVYNYSTITTYCVDKVYKLNFPNG